VSTAVPLISVVEVIEYVPVHIVFGTMNGNEMAFDVFGGIVKGGVVNISVFVLPQELELRGPVNSNFTLIDCELLVHDITSALTVTVFSSNCGWADSDPHVMA
jgi:hypothetical protein